VLPEFPKRVVLKKVLPPLLEELKNSVMMPFALVPVMIIAEECSVVEFETLLFDHLVPIFEVTEPVQVQSIFMHKVGHLSPSMCVTQSSYTCVGVA
jgi:SCY1-like protein 2